MGSMIPTRSPASTPFSRSRFAIRAAARVELRVGELGVVELDRDAVAVLGRRPGQILRQVHPRSSPRDRPALRVYSARLGVASMSAIAAAHRARSPSARRVELAAAIRARELTSREVVDAHIALIEAPQPGGQRGRRHPLRRGPRRGRRRRRARLGSRRAAQGPAAAARRAVHDQGVVRGRRDAAHLGLGGPPGRDRRALGDRRPAPASTPARSRSGSPTRPS